MSKNSTIALDTLKWFNKFNGKSIRIKSKSKDFFVDITNDKAPHLLGLHYIFPKNSNIKGNALFEYVIKNRLTDSDVYNKVSRNYNNLQASNVRKRINTFKDFMENIDKATIVEKTAVKSKIKSTYLAIKQDGKEIKHLGFLDIGTVNMLVTYDVSSLETYIVQGNDYYYKGTTLNEPVEQILFYEPNGGIWRAGSFDLSKDAMLINTALGIAEEKLNEVRSVLDSRENDIVEYNGFSFLPLREFTDKEKDMSIREISKYLMNDGLSQIGAEKDFYSKVTNKCDLFYCIENRSIYLPCTNGFEKWNVTSDEAIDILKGNDLNKIEKSITIDSIEKAMKNAILLPINEKVQDKSEEGEI